MPEKGIINSMRRFAKGFLALVLAALMLLEVLPAAAAAGTARAPGNGAAAVFLSGGNNSSGAGVQGVDASGPETRFQAKKKKNKNSSTESPKATATPAPADNGTKTKDRSPETSARPKATPVPEGPITDPQSIADYLFSHNMRLPDNFITKKEAQSLGWGRKYRYVSDAAPGKSIGGDYFGNYQGLLPAGRGITYHEADCYYTKGSRNEYRVVYSNEGRVWYTEDHYNTFTELFPTVP